MKTFQMLLLGVALVGVTRAPLRAQSEAGRLPYDAVALEDLSAFRSPGANWRVAGAAWADRTHDQHLEASAGTGVLVNLPDAEQAANLFTDWDHGDLELEVEVLMPRGSNSGIYLQGRYEVQLLDSWAVRRPTFADAGGIYQRWDENRPEAERGYEGHPPRVNASRAPGLWQTFHILFRAPRFDAAGRKTRNARFVRVVQNGIVVHENVDVTGPTRAAAFQDERPLGPLMFQGDHGPVAFRNLRYKRYTGGRLEVSELRYRVAEGAFETLDAALAQPPVREGETDGVSSAPAGVGDEFSIVFDGTISVPSASRYVFELGFDWVNYDPQFAGTVVGGGRLVIDGREVLVHRGVLPSATGEIELEAGEHTFSLAFYKKRPYTDRVGVSLFVEGVGIERHALHDQTGTGGRALPLIAAEPGAEPVVLRGFVLYDDSVRTHAASVGDPEAVHYAYDLAQGALLYAWRGPFLETTEMWHSRGERQLAQPQGSVLTLSGAPALAFLADQSAPWPDSLSSRDFRPGGYELDDARHPTFLYRLADVDVEDRIRPVENGGGLHRELLLRAPHNVEGMYVRLAAAERIDRLDNGSYIVGDRTYYVVPDENAPAPALRNVDDRAELLIRVRFRNGESKVAYTIVW